MIPKLIHYIWFGSAPEPTFESWKQHLPDYEFRKWTEHELDIEKYSLVKVAYAAKKFGMAVDPFRAEILYEHGGIWLDTDVVIHKNLDPFLQYSFFVGYEALHRFNPGLIGIAPTSSYMKRVLDWYTQNWMTTTLPVAILEDRLRREWASSIMLTKLFTREYGILPDGVSKTVGDMRLEAPPVFTIRGDYGVENYAEHLYAASWIDKPSDYYDQVVRWYRGHTTRL